MTKAELVDEVALAAKLTRKESEVIVDEVFKNIVQTLNRGSSCGALVHSALDSVERAEVEIQRPASQSTFPQNVYRILNPEKSSRSSLTLEGWVKITTMRISFVLQCLSLAQMALRGFED